MGQNGDMKQVSDEDPHVLDAIVQNYDTTAPWRKVLVHSWFIPQRSLCLLICTVRIKTDRRFGKL